MLKELLTLENLTFIVPMLIMTIKTLQEVKANPNEESIYPTLIAATGIIGTFAGIFLGLLNFDQSNITGSIPELLKGMKTAFLTSLIGLFLSNVLKLYHFNTSKNIKEEVVGSSLESIANLLNEMKKSIEDGTRAQEKSAEYNMVSIDKLLNSLVGEDEGSLTSQMKKMRMEMVIAQEKSQVDLNKGLNVMNESLNNLVKGNLEITKEIERGNNILIEEFRLFSQKMAENNMKVFIEAIQECISDLNNQLKEQFGENFKHLNYAVEKLLEWQENYKETIERTNETQEILQRGILNVKDSVSVVVEKSSSIIDIANALGDKIVTLDTQEKSLNESIKILNDISKEAKESIPHINTYMKEATEGAKNSHKTTQNNIIENSEAVLSLTKEATKNINTQQEVIVKSIEEITKNITLASELNIGSIESQIKSLETALVRLENDGFSITKKISDNIQVMIDNNNTNLQNSVTNINTQLETTLNKSLESLGNQLASVSEKFVSDYIPLTKELEKVVSLAKRVG